MAEAVALDLELRGAAYSLFWCRDRQVVLSGPAGTGKTRAALEHVHNCMLSYPNARALLLRKTHASLTSTALVTYRNKVLHELDGVAFFGGSSAEPPQYRYPNGSRVMVGGLDNPQKIMSGEYDMIYVNEATDLVEDDFEKCDTRLRNNVMPWQQLIADCNPGPPNHWLKQRCDAGLTTMLESRHEDNPVYFNTTTRQWTEMGAAYVAALDRLTGVRKLRLRHGIWAAAEGMVYDEYDPVVHLIDPFPIPATWKRYWAIDFGYTNPFVCQWWAEDGDGRLYRYRELYMSQRLVEDHARQIKSVSEGEPKPAAVICDHDAEGRATLERHLGINTVAARKVITDGIQALQARLRRANDGKPRLMLMRGATVEIDPVMVDKKMPTSTEGEIEAYVWDVTNGRKKGEVPVDENNHGLDPTRYVVMHVDRPRRWGVA